MLANPRMDIKIIKQLGQGVMGTVFLAESAGRRYIYKIEKMNDPDIYERQVDFDTNVAKFYPDYFLTLKYRPQWSDCSTPIFIISSFFRHPNAIIS